MHEDEDDIEDEGEGGDECQDDRDLDSDECADILQPWLEWV